MSTRTLSCLAVVVLITTGCGYGRDDSPAGTTPSPGPTFNNGTVLIDTGPDSVVVNVQVAQTDEERAFGLMNRKSLAADSGMVFIFFSRTTGGFYMKDTLIPLSIAFFDVDGRIVKILDMDPCRSDPCEVYEPGVAYMGALEVNQGAFDRWGVAPGDHVVLTQNGF